MLNTVKVIFKDSKHNYKTSVASTVTEEEAKIYFIGNLFNVGVFPKEDIKKCISIKYKNNNPI